MKWPTGWNRHKDLVLIDEVDLELLDGSSAGLIEMNSFFWGSCAVCLGPKGTHLLFGFSALLQQSPESGSISSFASVWASFSIWASVSVCHRVFVRFGQA
jgi:hypothetical protein